MKITDHLTLPFCLFVAIAVPAALLIGAHSFERFAELTPCALCLDQREAHWAAFAFFLAAFLATRLDALAAKGWPLLFMGFGTAAMITGLYISGYHTGVEYGWWEGPQTCSTGSIPTSLDDLPDKVIFCDDVPWSLFGISMAGFNFLITLFTLPVAALPLIRFFGGTRHD